MEMPISNDLDLIQKRFRLALESDKQQAEKHTNYDYPGFWLFVVEEELGAQERDDILRKFKLRTTDVARHKVAFCQAVGRAVQEEQES